MRITLGSLACLMGLVSWQAAAEASPRLPSVDIYGFLRVDGIYADSRMQHPQYSMWVRSEGNGGDAVADDAEMTIYPRLTRFGVRLEEFCPTQACGVRLGGKFEIDFQNGGSAESRPAPRLRHGYGTLRIGHFELLAGQTWDLVSPLFPAVHADALLWNAGNTGDRRAQVRLTYAPSLGGKSVLRLAVAAAMPGAIDKQDIDDNGTLDGLDAAVPMGQALVELVAPLWTRRAFRVGAWGHLAVEETSKPIGTSEASRWTSWSAGAHLVLPVAEWLWLRGEFFVGRDLSDLRGGIGQGVNAKTGQTIRAIGGWAEVGAQPFAWLRLAAGSSLDDPDDADVPTGGRTRNWTAYGMVDVRPWKAWRVALEYEHWVTDYAGKPSGTANRFDLHLSYYF